MPSTASTKNRIVDTGTQSPTPAERRLRAQIAANESWAATVDRTARTAPARAALDRKFLDAADGDPARAANLRKAHFQRLALKSAQTRRRNAVLTPARLPVLEPHEAEPRPASVTPLDRQEPVLDPTVCGAAA